MDVIVPCWKTTTNNPEVVPTSTTITTPSGIPNAPVGAFTANLNFGMVHPQVLTLQQMLNTLGFTITQSGAGSPGNETTKFGLLTRDSVRRFQCAKGIVCAGDEGTTGYGYVGSRTRQALLNASPAQTSTGSTGVNQVQPVSPNIDDKSVKINTLQSQIDQYQKLINDLQLQITTLKAGQ